MNLPSVSAGLEDARTHEAEVRSRAVSLEATVSASWPLRFCIYAAT